MASTIPFSDLRRADLVVEAIYEGGRAGSTADDPLGRLLPCGNQGGFRYSGSKKDKTLRMVLLYTSGADPDWPDVLDRETGLFTYFGDNRKPGKALHDTPRGGNDILRWCFGKVHGTPPDRAAVPPFFLFSKASRTGGRDVQFLGLAVPGAQDVQPSEDLVALWRTSKDERFQNYRSTFTILDVAAIPRSWLDELAAGQVLGPSCPEPYRRWVQTGAYSPLESPRNVQYRTPAQQHPESASDAALVCAVYDHFCRDPYAFEACAIELWKMQAKESVTYIATRRSSDGGRDAYGWYHVGPEKDRIRLEWSLEAKLYKPENGVGVRDTSRLISRIRHREFGVLVTTSYVGLQAYDELRGDQHPVVVICGRDIAELLRHHGYGTVASVKAWLRTAFPVDVA